MTYLTLTYLHLSPRVEIDMLVDGSATTASYMGSACQYGSAGCEATSLLGHGDEGGGHQLMLCVLPVIFRQVSSSEAVN